MRRAKLTVRPNLSVKTVPVVKPQVPSIPPLLEELPEPQIPVNTLLSRELTPSVNVNINITSTANREEDVQIPSISAEDPPVVDISCDLNDNPEVTTNLEHPDNEFRTPALPPPITSIIPFELNVPADRSSRANSVISISSDTSENTRKRKAFTGKEELDVSKFTMHDLIYWNPKAEQSLDKEKFKLKHESLEPRQVMVKKEEAAITPRVKIDEDGNLIIDKESLVVKQQADQNIWETVDEDKLPRKITSLSFRKNKVLRRSVTWTDEETDLFYEILQATGPDFTLMNQFCPSRARAEYKAKYNREEKYHWDKINAALRSPAILDDDLLEYCHEKGNALEREKREKEEEKERRKKELAETREKKKAAKEEKLRILEERRKAVAEDDGSQEDTKETFESDRDSSLIEVINSCKRIWKMMCRMDRFRYFRLEQLDRSKACEVELLRQERLLYEYYAFNRRSLTAFQLYSKELILEMQHSFPVLHRETLMGMLGAMWDLLKMHEKLLYVKKSEEEAVRVAKLLKTLDSNIFKEFEDEEKADALYYLNDLSPESLAAEGQFGEGENPRNDFSAIWQNDIEQDELNEKVKQEENEKIVDNYAIANNPNVKRTCDVDNHFAIENNPVYLNNILEENFNDGENVGEYINVNAPNDGENVEDNMNVAEYGEENMDVDENWKENMDVEEEYNGVNDADLDLCSIEGSLESELPNCQAYLSITGLLQKDPFFTKFRRHYDESDDEIFVNTINNQFSNKLSLMKLSYVSEDFTKHWDVSSENDCNHFNSTNEHLDFLDHDGYSSEEELLDIDTLSGTSGISENLSTETAISENLSAESSMSISRELSMSEMLSAEYGIPEISPTNSNISKTLSITSGISDNLSNTPSIADTLSITLAENVSIKLAGNVSITLAENASTTSPGHLPTISPDHLPTRSNTENNLSTTLGMLNMHEKHNKLDKSNASNMYESLIKIECLSYRRSNSNSNECEDHFITPIISLTM
uniref:HMG box domain-containing protein n=1 Tax=Rhabditophanes sp. KR3021 TaxID=114890 RepID=A0AC35TZP3_9BILA